MGRLPLVLLGLQACPFLLNQFFPKDVANNNFPECEFPAQRGMIKVVEKKGGD
jgi:hypothetical protein